MTRARYILFALTLALCVMAPATHATVTAFFSVGTTCGGAAAAPFTIGTPLEVSLCVSTTSEKLCAHSMFLQAASPSENGRFFITARTLGPGFPTAPTALPFPFDINNPNTAPDLGGYNTTPQVAASNQLLATLTLVPQTNALHTSYIISTAPATSVEVDSDGTCGNTVTASVAASLTLGTGGGSTPPTITSASTTTFTVGAAGSFIISATGIPPPTLSFTGALPAGVSFNTASGVLSGTPTLAGTYPLTITASNGTSVPQAFTLVVTAATVTKTNQTISFAGPNTQTLSTAPITLTANSTSGLAVVFGSSSPLVCTVSGTTLTMIAAGICTVTANQPGNANFNPAPPITYSFTITVPVVTNATDTATVSASVYPLPPALIGRSLTLTALIKMRAPAGSVTFAENGVALSGCAQRALSLLADATDAAVATCIIAAPAAPSSGTDRHYVATYAYPPNHPSGRITEQVNVDITFLIAVPPSLPAFPDYTDMWWAGVAENGWGLSITQHGLIQFNVIFAYDNAGLPLWYVMPGGAWNASQTAFTGDLYQPTSSPFSAYNRAQFVPGAAVGRATITYLSPSTATLTFTINGVSGTKSIQRQLFATDTGQPRAVVNDLWWAGAQEDGWGMNIAQQDRVLFPVWYTYDASGHTTFFTVPGGTWNGTAFTGDIYITVSSAWLGVAYNPAHFVATKAGTMTLNFADLNNATMTYTVNGITQTKNITRQPF